MSLADDEYRVACRDVVNTAVDLVLGSRFRESVDGWGNTVWVLDPTDYAALRATALRVVRIEERIEADDTGDYTGDHPAEDDI